MIRVFSRSDEWTPTIVATGTDPNLGSGSDQHGEYHLLSGGLVIAEFTIICGSSGTSAGSGTYTFSLPIPPRVDALEGASAFPIGGNVESRTTQTGDRFLLYPWVSAGSVAAGGMRLSQHRLESGVSSTVIHANVGVSSSGGTSAVSNNRRYRGTVTYFAAT